MNFDDYNILEEIVREMRQELGELENKIKYNLQCMKEADIYAHLLIDSEPEDYKLFSPRNVESVHGDEIKKAYQEKENCAKLNEQLYVRRNLLEEQVEGLEKVLAQSKVIGLRSKIILRISSIVFFNT